MEIPAWYSTLRARAIDAAHHATMLGSYPSKDLPVTGTPDQRRSYLHVENARAALGAAARRLLGADVQIPWSKGGFQDANPHVLHTGLAMAAFGSAMPVPIPPWCAWLQFIGVLKLDFASLRHDEGGDLFTIDGALGGGTGGRATSWIKFVAPRYAGSASRHLALFPNAWLPHWNGAVMMRAVGDEGENVLVGPPPTLDGSKGRVKRSRLDTWAVFGERSMAEPRFHGASAERLPPGLAFPIGSGNSWPLGWPSWVYVTGQSEGWSTHSFASLFYLPHLAGYPRPANLPAPGEESASDDRRATPGGPTTPALLGLDIGTTTSSIVLQDARGDRQDLEGRLRFSKTRAPLSGWRNLSGTATAGAADCGCGEYLQVAGEYLPTRLVFASEAIFRASRQHPLLSGAPSPWDRVAASSDVWLPQVATAGPTGEPGKDARPETAAPDERRTFRPFELGRFKSPKLLQTSLSEPLLEAESDAELLLRRYAEQVGLMIAAAVARPLPSAEGKLQAPAGGSLAVVMTAPELLWSDRAAAAASEPRAYIDVFRSVGDEALVPALESFWQVIPAPNEAGDRAEPPVTPPGAPGGKDAPPRFSVTDLITGFRQRAATPRVPASGPASPREPRGRMVHMTTERAAVQRWRLRNDGAREDILTPHGRIHALVDFGGLNLQVETLAPAGERVLRPRAFFMPYSIGGECVLEGAALVRAEDPEAMNRGGDALGRFLEAGRVLRHAVEHAGVLPGPDAEALRHVIEERHLALILRQVSSLRTASDRFGRLDSATLDVTLIGQGWLLFGMDSSDATREKVVAKALKERFEASAGSGVLFHYLQKNQLTRGAILDLIAAMDPAATPEASTTNPGAVPAQTFHGVPSGVHATGHPSTAFAAPDPSAAVRTPPNHDDAWWRRFTRGRRRLARRAVWFAPDRRSLTDLFDVQGDDDNLYWASESRLLTWVDEFGDTMLAYDYLSARLPPAGEGT